MKRYGWGENKDHPVEDWKYEVANGDTRLGYDEWVASAWPEPADDTETDN